jgi:hypothetical protein
MALNGYKEVQFKVKIKMAQPLIDGGDHSVTFSGPVADPLDVTITTTSMSFNVSNWSAPQDLILTGHRVGHIPINYIVTAEYTSKQHHGVFFVEIDPVPTDEFIPTGAYVGANINATDAWQEVGFIEHVLGQSPVVFHQPVAGFPDQYSLRIYGPGGSLFGPTAPGPLDPSGTYVVQAISSKGSGSAHGTTQTIIWDSLYASNQSHTFDKLTIEMYSGAALDIFSAWGSFSYSHQSVTTLVGFTLSSVGASTGGSGGVTYSGTMDNTGLSSYSASYPNPAPTTGHGSASFLYVIPGGDAHVSAPGYPNVSTVSGTPVSWEMTY